MGSRRGGQPVPVRKAGDYTPCAGIGEIGGKAPAVRQRAKSILIEDAFVTHRGDISMDKAGATPIRSPGLRQRYGRTGARQKIPSPVRVRLRACDTGEC